MTTVLVTGGSGFLGSYCILRLLLDGYRVRTTVRSSAREAHARTLLRAGGLESGDDLSFFVADLRQDAGWAEAVGGCDYVLHAASPFMGSAPGDIKSARDSALRVLRVSRDAGVTRLVLTSSFATIGYGKHPRNRLFTEQTWTDVNARNAPYIRSRTIVERAAWGFIAREGGGLELSVINPAEIFGPLLGAHLPSSIAIIKRMLDGDMRRLPKAYFGIVDVRDLADLHVRAMIDPAAKGERFIAVAGNSMSMEDIAEVLRRGLGEAAKRVPAKALFNWQLRLAALFSPAARQIVPNLGKRRDSSTEKAESLLGWRSRTSEEAILMSARSLIQFGLLEEREMSR